MNRGIQATASGMIGAQQLLDTITANLANTSTAGYKKEGVAFNDAFSQALRANGGDGPEIGSLGTGPTETARFTDMSVGQMTVTGNPLDVAIETPKGFFAVKDGDGNIRYTRNGSFELNKDGELVNKLGYQVLDDRGQAIQLGKGEAIIGEDGAITIDGVEQGKIGVWDGTFSKLSGTEFTSKDAQPMSDPELKPKAIEGSNVNPIETMVGMISLNRSFELAQRSIIQQDDLTQRLIQSLNQG